jgi:xylulokinase
MDYVMAIDLGSTSLKAVIYDLDGTLIASAGRPTERVNPSPEHPEWAIWEPDQIWEGAAAAAKEAVAQAGGPSNVKGVAVTGMGMDGVPIGGDGKHLYPFISWHDPRTGPQADWWKEQIGAERTFAITGFPCWPITAAMRILWMKENEPAILARAKKWLLIEDFLNHKLCGEIATDYSMASCMLLLDQRKLEWSDELLEASGIDRDLLPDPRPSGTPLGAIHAEAAAKTGLAAGTPVILGGHDHICGSLPVGAHRPGTLLDVLGTWEVIQTAIPAPVLTAQVQKSALCVQAHVAPGMHAAWGAAVAGEALEWYRKEYGAWAEQKAEAEGGAAWDHLLAELAGTKPGASGVMFLPHISAAGCPIEDNRSLAAFVGISNTATRADMLRAVIEGLNYQFLDIVRCCESGLGCTFDKITAVGGVTRNEFWIQNKADMVGVPVEVSDVEEASPLGAAILAGVGLGLYKDVNEAYERVKKPCRIFTPRDGAPEAYAESFKIYKEIYPALSPVSHRLFDAHKA